MRSHSSKVLTSHSIYEDHALGFFDYCYVELVHELKHFINVITFDVPWHGQQIVRVVKAPHNSERMAALARIKKVILVVRMNHFSCNFAEIFQFFRKGRWLKQKVSWPSNTHVWFPPFMSDIMKWIMEIMTACWMVKIRSCWSHSPFF
jgi:hypothetical protein